MLQPDLLELYRIQNVFLSTFSIDLGVVWFAVSQFSRSISITLLSVFSGIPCFFIKVRKSLVSKSIKTAKQILTCTYICRKTYSSSL